jgi:hypothetical protein
MKSKKTRSYRNVENMSEYKSGDKNGKSVGMLNEAKKRKM